MSQDRRKKNGKQSQWKCVLKPEVFKAMKSSQWCAAQLVCSLWHISSDLGFPSNMSCLVNIYLSLITWMSYESINMELKLALGHGRVIPTVRTAGTVFGRVWTCSLGLGCAAPSARWLSRLSRLLEPSRYPSENGNPSFMYPQEET